MDRIKSVSSNRCQKKNTGIHNNEFFALGNKNNRDEQKPKSSSIKSSSVMDRKRESTTTHINCQKKTKFNESATTFEIKDEHQPEFFANLPWDSEHVEFVEEILIAIENEELQKTLHYLCCCIKNLKMSYNRIKYDPYIILVLTYLCKVYPNYFQDESINSALTAIFQRDNFKTRNCIYSQIVACNLLARNFCYIEYWPDTFLNIYIEDAINERNWVDNILCSKFVKNITSAFKTKIPETNVLLDIGITSSANIQLRDTVTNVEEEFSGIPRLDWDNNIDLNNEVEIRYSDADVQKIVLDIIKEQLNKRQQQDCYTRNFLKFLCSTSGLADVRHNCVYRLEQWIHNGKLVKVAQQLLLYIITNLSSLCVKDQEVLAILIKMRFKTKPLINTFMCCFKQLIYEKNDLLLLALKLVVQNELSNTRNPNNMGMLASMFQICPDKSASHLAEIYKELLLQREDFIRTLRVFLRELVRMLRFDVNIVVFCKEFLNGKLNLNKQIEQSEYKERIFHSMVDIICLSMILCASPQVREASISVRNAKDNKINAVLTKFYSQMSEIQLDAISWMYEIVPELFKISPLEYNQSLQRILILESAEHYSRFDQWPSEAERATLLRIISETPIHEETLLRIILIGITKNIPLTIPDTIDILMLVMKRVSAMKIIGYPAINVNKFDIIDFLFSMTEYHHPENIKLPDDYDPPKLAITILYWKAWLIMVMISAHNPSTFGAFCWKHYPTMKILIEMCITNQFNDNNLPNEDIQVLSIERDHIIEFESYLAAQTSHTIITEENAILISQLMLMDPMGPARRVPSTILEQLKYLNKTLKLGDLLCRSRKPDLLLDIIERQGTTQSMPWLSDLVQNSEGEFSHLPVQCLCEFLMFNASGINEDNSRDAELLHFLRNIIIEPESNTRLVCEIVDYMFRRLSASNEQSRITAMDGIRLIFKIPKAENNFWLIKYLPQNAHFINIKEFIIPLLRSACQVENCPNKVMSYIQFIVAHTRNDSISKMLDHVIDMAQLIVERSTLFQYLIPVFKKELKPGNHNFQKRLQTLKCLFVMFNNYIVKLKDLQSSYEWTEYPDLMMVQFQDGTELPLHLNIIHAFIILLTYAPQNMPESFPILNYWFPKGNSSPCAHPINARKNDIQLFPDWLKLKMIRSPVSRLIDAAMYKLTSDQIVLFVQNFGTPINSMSKLLAQLDHAVVEQGEYVKNAILNKNYLGQLIDIQRGRGVKNGYFTVKALKLYTYSEKMSRNIKYKCTTFERINVKYPLCFKTIDVHKTEDINTILSLLNNHMDDERYRCNYRQIMNTVLHNKENINVAVQFRETFKTYFEQFFNTFNQYNFSVNNIFTLTRVLQKTNFHFMSEVLKEFTMKQHNLYPYGAIEKAAYFFKRYGSSLLKNSNRKHYKKKNKLQLNSETIWKLICHCLGSKKYAECKNFDTELKLNDMEQENDFSQGLLVDRLIEIDPEFKISATKNLHISMLFSQDFKEFRFYLLSIICHQSNWKTLVSTLKVLLDGNEHNLDYSAVLNFFEALIYNSRLCQGNDINISNFYFNEFIINLNHKELKIFTSLLIKEGQKEMKVRPSQYNYRLCSRINLLLKTVRRNPYKMIKFLDNILKSPFERDLKSKIFQQVYLFYPSIKFLKWNNIDKATMLLTLKGCQADKISNCLITCLGNIIHKKDFESFSSDTELLIRKMTASHPSLFLRQLGVLISLIQDKAQLNTRVIRDSYHFHRFSQILRIIELLQPTIFDDRYKTEFLNCMDCYFLFFKTNSNVKDIFYIVIKFVEILRLYIDHNPSSSIEYLDNYVPILMELSTKINSNPILHKLLEEIASLQYRLKSEMKLSNKKLKVFSTYPTLSPSYALKSLHSAEHFQLEYSNSKSSIVSVHYSNIINIINHSVSEEMLLAPLQEIECLTSKRFSLLNDIFDRLLQMIFSQSAQIRSIAFILLIRHLKHNSGNTEVNRCALNAYIKCLRDSNLSIATTAIDHLTEITILLHEYTLEILTLSFSLGLKSRLNTCTQIKRILQALQLQYGC